MGPSKQKATFLILLSACLVTLAGCSYVWTRKFVLPKHSQLESIEGWTVEPELYAYDNVGSKVEPASHIYSLTVKLARKRAVKNSLLFDLPLLEIDSLTILEKETGEVRNFLLSHATWVSSTDYDSLDRALSFEYHDSAGPQKFFIDKSIDTLIIQFVGRVSTGAHVIVRRNGAPCDSIAPTTLDTTRFYPAAITMIRYESKHRIPAFLINKD